MEITLATTEETGVDTRIFNGTSNFDLYAPQGQLCWTRDKDNQAHVYTELRIDGYVGSPTDFDNLVTVQDDWNASAAEKRASADAELREDMAYMASAGVDWWGSISLSGFGPTAHVDAGGSGKSLLKPSHVITTVPSVDADELRDEAGMRPAGSFETSYRVAGTYHDFLQAASVSTPELDDLFTSEGYSWDNLSEAQVEDKALRIEAWWN